MMLSMVLGVFLIPIRNLQIKAATVVALSPRDMEKIKEKIPAGDGGGRSYLKTNGKETVWSSGSALKRQLSGVT